MIPPFLLGVGAKLLARPGIALALVAALTFGVREFQYRRTVNHLNAEVSRVTGLYQQERTQRLDALLALEQVEANRDQLAVEVRRQNDAIVALEQSTQTLAARSSVEAVRAFNKGLSAAEALRQPTTVIPPGHAAMNEYLTQRLGGTP